MKMKHGGQKQKTQPKPSASGKKSQQQEVVAKSSTKNVPAAKTPKPAAKKTAPKQTP